MPLEKFSTYKFTSSAATARALSIFRGPENTAAVFWGAGAAAILTILPMEHWDTVQLAYLLIAEVFSLAAAAVRITHQSWVPKWSSYVGLVIGTFGIGGLVWVTQSYSMNLSVLFIWISLYTALNFPIKGSMYMVALVGAVYAAVLVITGTGAAVENWLQITGTSLVAGGTVSLLVEELRVNALQDPLTKLPNRRAWKIKLDEEYTRAKRTLAPLGVAMIDIDGMKDINDEFGHMAGDAVLKALGANWAPIIRTGTLIARIGGDEFAIVAPDTDKADLEKLLARLTLEGAAVTFSAGIAVWDGAEEQDMLLQRADKNMYKMKSQRFENPGGPSLV